MALEYEAKIEQVQGTKLDARWRGPYLVTDITQSLGTFQLAEPDGAERVGWLDGSQLSKFLTQNEGMQGTREISMPSTAEEEESMEFEEFDVEAVVCWKQIEP